MPLGAMRRVPPAQSSSWPGKRALARGLRWACTMNPRAPASWCVSLYSGLPVVISGVALLLPGCGSNATKPGHENQPASNAGTGGASGSSGGSSTKGGSSADSTCTVTAEPGELVQVPAGDFTMGCKADVDSDCSDDEKPMHVVTLSAFEIGKTEVTQAQYSACVVAGACDPPTCDWNCEHTDFPASCLSRAQASAYCSFVGERLPSEAEWEKAARGDKGLKYPWGDAEPDCTLSNMAGCADGATAVGSLTAGASPYGALDMAGNVVELLADVYDAGYYAGTPAVDPKGPANGTRYVGRGGGFKSDAEFVRTSKRDWYDTTDAAASLGFRCAR
jgi:formylglycine-generating enzyme required for sulfatase activity